MDKEKKKGGKFRKIVSWMVSLLVIIVLFNACTGSFDDTASDVTDGAYGTGEDEITATVEKEETEKTELSTYIDYTEDELIKVLDVEKSEFGYYPNDDEVNFICMDGKVYSVMINKNNDNDSNFMICGIVLEDNSNQIGDKLGDDFELLDSADVADGKRDTYKNKENGYLLAVDYGSDNIITGISYVAEVGAEAGQEMDSSAEEAITWLDSIGALGDMESWASEEDIVNLYNSIQTDMQSWNVTMTDMRSYVEDFEPNLTLDEIAELSDYQIYVCYGKLMGYVEEVDAEEPDWEDDMSAYVVTEDNIVDWFRNATDGDYVQVTGKVMGVYNFSDNKTIQLSFYVDDRSIYLTCEGNFDINNIMEGDTVTVLGTYKGKNASGYGVIDTQSVSLN